jgi:general L-amino acid transport system permease protein
VNTEQKDKNKFAAIGQDSPRPSLTRIIYNERFRAIFYQVVVFTLIFLGIWYLADNVTKNYAKRGMIAGIEWLKGSSGFDISWSLIPYEPTYSYFYVYLVGICNTLLIGAVAIIGSTILGFIVGIMRLSKNYLVALVASWFVELVRNTPVLLQLFFWYLGVLTVLPSPRQSIDFMGLGWFIFNNRGIYSPKPVPGDLFWLTLLSVIISIAAAYFIALWAKRRQLETGERFPAFWTNLSIILIVPTLTFLVTGSPLDWDYAVLKGFNYKGGSAFPPSFCALALALIIYSAAHAAETIRGGILSVSKGQKEAAFVLGLKPGWTMRLVIIPQAMRAIMPTMISMWMNIVKNSSIAVAVGYPDVVALFMTTTLNQAGHAIEIVAMVMFFYSTVSLTISAALNVYNKKVQIKER